MTTVRSARNRLPSESYKRTLVKATGDVGVFTSDFASAGACAAIAFWLSICS